MLGGGEGWHAEQLRSACDRHGSQLEMAAYESLSAQVGGGVTTIHSSAGPVDQFDAVLTRTMPVASLDRITLRLAMLHHLDRQGFPIVNSPAALEIAIDKFATLAVVASLGFPVPETRVVQSRGDAMSAFDQLGGDCVVKPLFGGEGRGVMRVSCRELAFTTFSTLDQLGCVIYLQRFVPPGGCDTRLLRIGSQTLGLRRTNDTDFRTNLYHGGKAVQVPVQSWQVDLVDQVCQAIGLDFGSVDLMDNDEGGYCVVEVNAIPGWKGAQAACPVSIADPIIEMLMEKRL